MPQCDGFGGAGVPPAPCSFLDFQTRQPSLLQDDQDGGATSPPAEERLNARLNLGE
jgi:hypothetical protein